ncbi:hypothetical protein [Allonocardiopsis opalescens]|uniref:ABC-type branched-subunit amino acid transport system substrate-binding protein n=1 Tax=Allonocardiopsis opalescens TaxID=1144618 RepID=A0A2T0Q9W7_9ACTN|nr:hypothetical protein [Allonocardiopsis opalescens]PRY00643.1 ABC-type branched-subunit amino acid transport system substrate-binding protein [Allonocardiopsis opalescens]
MTTSALPSASTEGTDAERGFLAAFDALRRRVTFAQSGRVRAEAAAARRRRDPGGVDLEDRPLSAGGQPLPVVRVLLPESGEHESAVLARELRDHCGNRPAAALPAPERRGTGAEAEDPHRAVAERARAARRAELRGFDPVWAALYDVKEQLARPEATPGSTWARRDPEPPRFPHLESLLTLVEIAHRVSPEELAPESEDAENPQAPAGSGHDERMRLRLTVAERIRRPAGPHGRRMDGRPASRAGEIWHGRVLDPFARRVFATVSKPFAFLDERMLAPASWAVNVLLVLGVAGAAGLDSVLSVLVLLVLVGYHLLAAFSWHLPWASYRWLRRRWPPFARELAAATEQAAGRPVEDGEFRDRAVLLIQACQALRSGSEELRGRLRCLAVNAFLDDLAAAYRRRNWLEAGGRDHYPVLAVDMSAPEGAELAEVIERVRRTTGWPDPLVLVAIGGHGADAAAPQDTPGDASACTLGARLRSWALRRGTVARLGPARYVPVALGAGELAALRGGLRPPGSGEKISSRRARFVTGSVVTAAIVLVLALVAGLLIAVGASRSDCWWGRRLLEHDVWQSAATGSCVGVTAGGFVFNERLASVQRRIAEQNEAAVRSGDYVDIVYFGALSVPDATQQNDLLGGVHGELVGLAIAQHEHNSTFHQRAPMVRLLLANAGPAYGDAVAVAERVVRRAGRDPRVLGVVGIGESREPTRQAIGVFTAAGLPMVATTVTFDDIALVGDASSDIFYPLAPSNGMIARHAASWAWHGTGELEPARTAVALADVSAGDLYGGDLAERFIEEFGAIGGEGTVRAYGRPEDPSLGAVVRELCRDAPDVLYFSGRSDQFAEVMSLLDGSDQCASGMEIIANDDIAKYVADNLDQLDLYHPTLELYYTPLAASSARARARDMEPSSFYERFDALGGELGWAGPDEGDSRQRQERPSVAHAVMAYDALMVVSLAARQAQESQLDSAEHPVTDLRLALTQVDGYAGVSGLIDLAGPAERAEESADGAAPGNWQRDRLVQLVLAGPGGGQEVVAVCGVLTSNNEATDDDCPPQE